MAIPFLPASLTSPTFTFLEITNLPIMESMKLENVIKYFKRRWIRQITPEELAIYVVKLKTNNGAESYHSKIKSIVKIPHQRI